MPEPYQRDPFADAVTAAGGSIISPQQSTPQPTNSGDPFNDAVNAAGGTLMSPAPDRKREDDPFAAAVAEHGGSLLSSSVSGQQPSAEQTEEQNDGKYSGLASGAHPISPFLAKLNNEGWDALKHPWDLVAGTPLIDLNPYHEKGWVGGLTDFGNQLLTPLSLALTGGGLFKTAATAILGEAGFTTAETASMVKGAQIAQKAVNAGEDMAGIQTALKGANVDLGLWEKASQALAAAKKTPADLLSGQGFITGAGGSMLRKMGADASNAYKISGTINKLVDAGFLADMSLHLAQSYPAFFDALKEGDYEKAKQLGVELAGNTAFTALGGLGLVHDAGHDFESTYQKWKFGVNPTHENNLIRKVFNETAPIVQQHNQEAVEFQRDIAKRYGIAKYKDLAKIGKLVGLGPKLDDLDLHAAKNLIEGEFKPDLLKYRYNILSDAAGLPGLKYADPQNLLDPQRLGIADETHQGYLRAAADLKLKDSRLYTPKDMQAMLESYRRAIELPKPAIEQLAREVNTKFADIGGRAQAAGVISNLIDAYTTNIWENPNDNPAALRLFHEDQQGDFHTNVTQARHRVFENSFEGQLLGYKLKQTDPVQLVSHEIARVGEAIATRKFLSDLNASGARASTGEQLAILAGTGKEVGKALLVNPNSVRSLRIAAPVIADLKRLGLFDKFLKEGRIIERGAGPTKVYFQRGGAAPRSEVFIGAFNPYSADSIDQVVREHGREDVKAMKPGMTGLAHDLGIEAEVDPLSGRYKSNLEPSFGATLNTNDPVLVDAYAAEAAHRIALNPQESAGRFIWDENGPDLRHEITGFNDITQARRQLTDQGLIADSSPLSHDKLILYDMGAEDVQKVDALARRERWRVKSETGNAKFISQDEYEQRIAEGRERAGVRSPDSPQEPQSGQGGGNNPSGQPGEQRTGGGAEEENGPTLHQRGARRPADVTEEEWSKLSASKQGGLRQMIDLHPPEREFKAAALSGADARNWYRRYTPAFKELLGEEDFPTFTRLLAALSPRISVHEDMAQALSFFGDWINAGRPTDIETLTQIGRDNGVVGAVKKKSGEDYTIDAGGGKTYKLPPNVATALTSKEPLSGPKVSAFTENLQGNLYRTTLDTWMQIFAGQEPKGYAPNEQDRYLAYQARVRKVARDLGWTPEQVQASIWTFTKTLAEMAGLGDRYQKPLDEVAKLMRPEDMRLRSRDLVDIITSAFQTGDQEIIHALEKLGIDESRVEAARSAAEREVPALEKAETPSARIIAAIARRLETNRAALEQNLRLKQEPPPLFAGLEEQPLQQRGGRIELNPETQLTPEQQKAVKRFWDPNKAGPVATKFHGDLQRQFKATRAAADSAMMIVGAEARFMNEPLDKFLENRVIGIRPGSELLKQGKDALFQQAERRFVIGSDGTFIPATGRLLHDDVVKQLNMGDTVEEVLGKGGVRGGVYKNVAHFEVARLTPDVREHIRDVLATNLQDVPKIEITDDHSRYIQLNHADADEFLSSGSSLPEAQMYQKEGRPQGAVQFLKDGKAVIYAFKGGNFSTIVHELGHIFRRDLAGDDLETIERHLGVKDGKWAERHEEKFARWVERYFHNGEAPHEELQPIFSRMADWMRRIYTDIKNSPIFSEIPDQVRTVLDKRFGLDEGIERRPQSGQLERPAQVEVLPPVRSMADPAKVDAFLREFEKQGIETQTKLSQSTDPVERAQLQKALQRLEYMKNNLLAKGELSNQPMRAGEAPKRLYQRAGEEGEEPVYAWSHHGYRDIDHSSARDWNYVTKAADGTPVMMKANMMVHPEAYDYISRIIGTEKSFAKELPAVKGLLQAGSFAKHSLLSLSPFHISQMGLRAVMSGVIPRVAKFDIARDPELKRLVEGSMTLQNNYRMREQFQEGLAGGKGIISKVPIIRDVQDWLNDFTFEKLMPSLKAMVGKELLKDWDKRFADASFAEKFQNTHKDFAGMNSDEMAARAAAQETNERLGGLNYKDMGRAAGAQDFLRLATLAPDWLESEMRMVKRLFDPTGGQVLRRDLVRMTAGLWLTSRLLNYVFTGKAHNEAPFGVAMVGKDGREKIYSIRTLPTDIMHLANDPWGFMTNRISPLGRTAVETISGREHLGTGRKIPESDRLVDLVRNVAPIPVQSVYQTVTDPRRELGTSDQIIKAGGGTVQIYKTVAENMAAKLASDRSEQGPVDPATLRRHQIKMQWEDDLRSGLMNRDELNQAVESGSIAHKEAKEIVKNLKETEGMTPEQARLLTRAQRLPMPEFLQVWDAATNDEKARLSKLLINKRKNYFKNAGKNLTPQERATDQVYQRLRSMFPTEPVF